MTRDHLLQLAQRIIDGDEPDPRYSLEDIQKMLQEEQDRILAQAADHEQFVSELIEDPTGLPATRFFRENLDHPRFDEWFSAYKKRGSDYNVRVVEVIRAQRNPNDRTPFPVGDVAKPKVPRNYPKNRKSRPSVVARRQSLYDFLCVQENQSKTDSELADCLGMSESAIIRHLRWFRESGFIVTKTARRRFPDAPECWNTERRITILKPYQECVISTVTGDCNGLSEGQECREEDRDPRRRARLRDSRHNGYNCKGGRLYARPRWASRST